MLKDVHFVNRNTSLVEQLYSSNGSERLALWLLLLRDGVSKLEFDQSNMQHLGLFLIPKQNNSMNAGLAQAASFHAHRHLRYHMQNARPSRTGVSQPHICGQSILDALHRPRVSHTRFPILFILMLRPALAGSFMFQ